MVKSKFNFFKHIFRLSIFVFVVFSIFSFNIHKTEAAACVAGASGNWSNTTTVWTGCAGGGNSKPSAGDTIQVNSGVALVVDENTLTVGNITVVADAGATGTNRAAITVNTGMKLTSSGTLTINGPTTTTNTTSVILSGTGALEVGALTFGTGATNRNITLNVGTGILTVNGAITAGSGGTRTITTSGAATFTFNNSTLPTGITYTINAASTTNFTGTTAVNSGITFGIVEVDSGTTSFGASTITVAGTTLVRDGATLKLLGFTTTFTGNVTVGGGTSGNISCTAGSSCTGNKTFNTLTVNTGGVFDMTLGTVAPTVIFTGTSKTVTHNGTTFKTGTGTNTISGTGALAFAGSSNMTFGNTVTIPTNRAVTVSNTGVVTFSALTMASPTAANSLTINNGSTVTVTNALTFTANATANAQTITLGSGASGAGNLNVGSIVMNAPTSTGASKITCFASSTQTGTLTVTGAGTIAITGNSTSTGLPSIDMSPGGCNIVTGTVAGTVVTLTNGSNATGGKATLKMGNGTLTMNGNLAFAGANAVLSVFSMAVSGGTLDLNGSTLPVVGTNGSYNFASTTNIISDGTSNINYATAVNTWGSISANTGTLSFAAATNATSVTVASGATLAMGANLLTNTGNLTCGSGGAGTATISGSAGITMSGASAVLDDAGGAGSTCAVTNSGTFLVSGSTAPSVGAGAAYTFSGILSVSTALTNNGTVTVNTGLAGAGNFTNAASSVLNIGFATAPTITTLTATSTSPDNLVNYTAASPNCKVTTYDDLTFSGSGTVTCAVTTVGDILTYTTGTTMDHAAATNLAVGSISIGSGVTFTSSSGNLTVGGNFTNNGTFNDNNGTILFTGAVTHAIAGSSDTTFHHMTDTVDASTITFKNDGGGVTPLYTFDSGGIFTVTGGASKITITSDTQAVNPWLVHFTSAQSAVTNAIISWSGCDGTSAAVTLDGTSTDGGNNDTCWQFPVAGITVSGTIYQTGSEATVFDCNAANITLHVSVNGGANTNGSCSAVGGTFTITNVTDPGAANIPIVIYTDSAAAQKATTVTLSSAGGTDITGLSLFIDRVTVSQESATALTNAHMATADNANAGIRYAVSGGNLTVESGMELHVLAGKTFTPGGIVTTTATSTAAGAAGDIHIDTGATLSMGSNALNVGGDFTNNGTFSYSIGQTTTFTATGTGFTVEDGTNNFSALTFNGVGGGWSLGSSITGLFSLTITNGTLTHNANSIAVNNTITLNGTLSGSGAGSITSGGGAAGNITGSGTLNVPNAAVTIGSPNATPISIFSSSGSNDWTLSSLTLNGTSSTPYSMAAGTGAINVSGNVTVSTATLSLGSRTWSIGGTLASSTASSATVIYTGNNAVVTPLTYNNLTINGTGTATIGGATVVNATLTATTAVTNNSTLTVTGALSGLTLTNGSGATLNIAGTSGITNLIPATSANTINYTGTAQTIHAPTTNPYWHLGFSGTGANTISLPASITAISGDLTLSGTAAVTTGASITVTGTTTIGTGTSLTNGAFTFISPNISITSTGGMTNNGTVTVNTALSGTGTFTNASGATLNIAGTSGITNLIPATSANTINYTGTAQTIHAPTTNPYWHLGFSGTGANTISLPASVTAISGNLALSGTASVTTGANLVVTGTTTIGDGTTLTLGAFTFESDGAMTVGGGTSGVFTATSGTGITLKGDLTLAVGSTWTKMTSGTVTFSKTSAQIITDNTATKQDLGAVSSATASTNLTLGSNVKVTTLNVGASTTLTPGSNTLIILGSGTGASRPFINNGTFTTGASTVDYEGTSATDIETTNVTYNNLSVGITANANAVTYTLNGNETMGGLITVGNAGSGAVDTLGLGSTTLTLSSTGTPLVITSQGALSAGSSTVKYTGNGATSTAGSYFNLQLVPSSSSQNVMGSGTYNIGGAFTVGDGTAGHNGAIASTNNPIINVTGTTAIATNATFTTGGGAVSFGDVTVSGTISGSGSGNISATGNVTGLGIINISGNTFTQNFGAVSKLFGTVSGSNSWSFNNLTFTGTSATSTVQGGTGSITVSGVLTISATTTLDMGSAIRTLILSGSGTPIVNNGVFTAGTNGTVQYTGNSADVLATTYNNLTLGGVGVYTLPASDITLRGNLSATSGATISKSASNKIIFAKGGSQSLTASGVSSDFGNIQVSANGTATTFGISTAKITSIVVDNSQTFTINPASTLTISGTGTGSSRPFITGTGVTFAMSSATLDFEGQTGDTDIQSGVLYNNLKLGATNDAGPGVNYNLTGATGVSGVLTLGNQNSLNADTLVLGSNTLTFTGTGTPLSLASNNKGLLSAGTSTVKYTGNGAISTATTYNNLELSPGGISQNVMGVGTYTIGGNLVIGDGTAGHNGAIASTNNPIINVTGTTTIATNATFTTGGGAWNQTGDLTVNGTLSGSGVGTITVNGNVDGSGTINISGNTFVQSIASAKSFGLTSGSNLWTFNNLTFSSSPASTVTLTSTSFGLAINGIMTIGANTTFDAGTSDGSITLAASGTPFVVSGTFIPNTTSNFAGINYGGSSATNITATTYRHLNINGSGTFTLPNSDLTIRGDLVCNFSTVIASASNKLIFAKGGGGTQNLSGGSSNLGNVQISANSGNTTLALATDAKVKTLTVDSAQTFAPSSNKLTVTGTGTGASRPFLVNGIFTPGYGTIDYEEQTGTTDLETTTYNSLIVGGDMDFSAGVTYNMFGTNTISGTLTVGNSSSSNTDTLALGSSSLTIGNLLSPFADNGKGVLDAGTSTVTYNGPGGGTFPAATYYNVIILPGLGLSAVNLGTFSNNTFVINGNLTIGNGASSASLSSGFTNAEVTINGTTTISNLATLTMGGGIGFNFNGDLVVDGTLNGSGGVNATVKGNMTGGGTVDLNFGAFNVSVASAKNFGPTSNIMGLIPNDWVFNALNFSSSTGSQTITVSSGTSDGQIQAQSLTVNANTTLDIGSSNKTLRFNSSNPLTVNGTFLPGNGTVEYVYGSTFNVVATTYNNLAFNCSLGVATLPNADITVRGDLTVSSGCGVSPSAANKIIFAKGGGGTQTITDNHGVDLGIVKVSANTGSTTLALGSNVKVTSMTVDAGQTLTVGAHTLEFSQNTTGAPLVMNGTLTPSTTSSVIIFNSNTGTTMTIPGNVAYYDLYLKGPGTFVPTAGTMSVNRLDGTDNNNPNINFNTNDPNVTVNGDFDTHGNVIASNSGTLTLRGNFAVAGTFTHSNGTVVLDPIPDVVLLKSTTYYNLENDTPGHRINFAAGGNLIIANQINFHGTPTNPIWIGSPVNGTLWYITLSTVPNGVLDFVVLSDVGCQAGNSYSGPKDHLFNVGVNNGNCWGFIATGGGTAIGNTTGGGGSGGGTGTTGGGFGHITTGGDAGNGGTSGGGGGILPQAFTGSDGTALVAYDSSWNVLAGAFAILNNQIRSNANNADAMARWTAGAFSDNQYAEIVLGAMVPGNYVGVAVRTQAGAHSGYGAYSDTNNVKIIKRVNGTVTELYSGAPFASTDRIRLEVNGSTLTLKENGTVITTVTDSTFSTGRPGMIGHGSDVSIRADDFYADSIASQGGGAGGGGGGGAGEP